MDKFYYNSQIGNLEIITENEAIISLKPTNDKTKNSELSTFQKEIKKQLDEYLNKTRKTFDLKINPTGSEFQKKVWNELVKIPYGKTKSYSEIAANIAKPNSQRAVGNACNKNPIMLIIPCHRVISKNGNLTGFAFGIDVKKRLLNLEL